MVTGSTVLAWAALPTLGPVTAGGTAHTTAAVVEERKAQSVPLHWVAARNIKNQEPFLENKLKSSSTMDQKVLSLVSVLYNTSVTYLCI